MKYLATLLIAFGLFSCSDCYECSQLTYITVNGQVIDSTEVTEDVCTTDQDVLDDYYQDGYTCQ